MFLCEGMWVNVRIWKDGQEQVHVSKQARELKMIIREKQQGGYRRNQVSVGGGLCVRDDKSKMEIE